MRALLRTWLLIVGWLVVPALAVAQVPAAAPVGSAVPHVEAPHGDDVARVVPIGGYTLATFWVPQHCKQPIRGIVPIDCAGARTDGLALHGLWPDGTGKEWPQWCRAAALLSPATITAHLAATPSAQQMQHEWAKHGTCMDGYTAERYFDRAEKSYRAIHIPDLRALSYRRQTVGSVKQAIGAANPGLTPEMFKLTLDKQGWLEEIWFCLDTRFVARACAEPQRESADAEVLIWRGGRAGARTSSGRSYGRRSYGGSRYGHG